MKMKKVFDKFLNHKIEVGDTVKAIDWENYYLTCRDWFIDNGIPKELCQGFPYICTTIGIKNPALLKYWQCMMKKH